MMKQLNELTEMAIAFGNRRLSLIENAIVAIQINHDATYWAKRIQELNDAEIAIREQLK